MRRGWLWAAAGLAVLGWMGAMPAAAGGKDRTMDENMINTTRTLCIGRYLVDLPATAVIHRASFDYDWQRATLNNAISHDAFLKEAQALEERLRRTPHKKDPSLLRILDRSKDGNSIVLAYWENDFSSYTSIVEGYRWTSDQLLKIRTEVDEDKVDIGVRDAKRALSEFRPRADDEIPTDPGFCIDGGFFAGEPEGNQEKASYRLTLKDRPDVWLYVYTDTVGRNEVLDGGLLARVAKPSPFPIPPDLAQALARVRTLRRGNHPVGPIPAEELLEALPTSIGGITHAFRWEAPGERASISRPSIVVEVETGRNHEGTGQGRSSSLADDEALSLFDAIVNSIRLRPTGGSPQAGAADAPPKAPLGTLAVTGRACPRTGLWQAEEGERRFLKEGERMPRTEVPGRLSLLDRLRGKRRTISVATLWKLVAYGQGTDGDSSPIKATGITDSSSRDGAAEA